MGRAASIVLGALWLAGCGSEEASIILALDPGGAGRADVTVVGAAGATGPFCQPVVQSLTVSAEPLQVALWKGETYGHAVAVRADAYDDLGFWVARREELFPFEPEDREETIALDPSCAAPSSLCAPDQACLAGNCQPIGGPTHDVLEGAFGFSDEACAGGAREPEPVVEVRTGSYRALVTSVVVTGCIAATVGNGYVGTIETEGSSLLRICRDDDVMSACWDFYRVGNALFARLGTATREDPACSFEMTAMGRVTSGTTLEVTRRYHGDCCDTQYTAEYELSE